MRSDDAEAYYRDRDPIERELDDDYAQEELRDAQRNALDNRSDLHES